MGAKRAAENAPSISANAFDDFQSTDLIGYDVPSKKSHEARVSLNSSGLTPTAASTAVSAASGVWLRRVLLTVAAFETLVGGLIDLAGVPDLDIINARLFIHPFLAIAALVLAARRYLRAAIVVLAAYILAALAIGWSLDFALGGLSLLAQQVIFGPLAVTAIVLAILDKLLWLGAVFVALPSANLLLGMIPLILFTIGVMIYGAAPNRRRIAANIAKLPELVRNPVQSAPIPLPRVVVVWLKLPWKRNVPSFPLGRIGSLHAVGRRHNLSYRLFFCRSNQQRHSVWRMEDTHMRQSLYGILIGAAAVVATSSIAFAGEQKLEFKLVTRLVNPTTVLEAANIEGQTMIVSKAVGVAYFKDGRVASKDFIITLELRNGSGPYKGYSTYTFEDGSSITASFTGERKSGESHGIYTIVSGTGTYANATG